jgi:hypothetical protein
MNALTSRLHPGHGKVAWFFFCTAMVLFVTTVVGAAQHGAGPAGAETYSPTRGEWLCVLLNARQALSNSERIPREMLVHFFHDRSAPNVIFVEVLADKSSDKSVVRRYMARAKERAIATSRIYGWQDWLRVEQKELEFTDASAAESLIR